MSESKPNGDAAPVAPRHASTWGGLARMVAWGLFGVRKASAHQGDLGRVNPLHVLVAALVGMVVLVALLIGLAYWMAGSS